MRVPEKMDLALATTRTYLESGDMLRSSSRHWRLAGERGPHRLVEALQAIGERARLRANRHASRRRRRSHSCDPGKLPSVHLMNEQLYLRKRMGSRVLKEGPEATFSKSETRTKAA